MKIETPFDVGDIVWVIFEKTLHEKDKCAHCESFKSISKLEISVRKCVIASIEISLNKHGSVNYFYRTGYDADYGMSTSEIYKTRSEADAAFEKEYGQKSPLVKEFRDDPQKPF